MGAYIHNGEAPRGKDGKVRYNRGLYVVQNKDKYIGDLSNVMYLSLWEKYFMIYLDSNPLVLKWGSETVAIPYQDDKGHYHRYYPDFYVEIKSRDDNDRLDRIIFEIKPEKEFHPDFIRENGSIIPAYEYIKKVTPSALESYEYKLKTFQKNLFKWTRAKSWCEMNGLIYKVITEDYLVKKGIMPDPKIMYQKKFKKR